MLLIFLSIMAGVVGTGLGGVITAVYGNSSERTICGFLSFAAGVMISIVCFGLIPEAIALSGALYAVFGLILGIIIIMILNRLIDNITASKQKGLHESHEELYHETSVIQNKERLFHSGIIMITAIALHNIPEGIAIGAGGSHNLKMGLMLVIMIALHNIPEGLAISAPLSAGGLSKVKVVLLTALSGAPTFIGAVVGMLLGNISDTAIAFSLAMAGGAMLYVVFGEIIPQSVFLSKERTPVIITLIGVIVGLCLTMM